MSLIELMLAVVIGLIVLGGLTSIVVATMRTNTDNTRMTRLTQEMRGAMQLITSDLRRSGFSRNALEDIGTGSTGNPFIAVAYEDDPAVENPAGIAAGFDDDNCVTYAFDGIPQLVAGVPSVVSVDGVRGVSEQYGVRYNDDDLTIEYHQAAGSAPDCGTDNGWERMTDPGLLEITALTFGDVDADGEFPCVQIGSAGSVTAITVREIQIAMTGHLADDPEIQRTIRDTVRVRNDIVDNACG